MITKRKVMAYITQRNRLLVFAHRDFPEAGIQVPAGTLKDDETPEQGALREAAEETGLDRLRVVGFLGERQRDMSDFDIPQIHHRYFYHLVCDHPTPETWTHGEFDPSDSHPAPILFDFFWAELPDGVPPLIGGHDALLPELIQRLRPNDPFDV